MLFSDKTYNVMKWVTAIGLPAAGALYFGLSKIWGFPLGEEVVGSLALITVFSGTLLGISTVKYNASQSTNEDAG